MVKNILIYWIGIIGVAGKGPNWMEAYNPDTTFSQIIQRMENNNFSERNKKIKMLKFKGDISKYDKNNPYWDDNTKLSEYLNYVGDYGNDIMVIYCIV